MAKALVKLSYLGSYYHGWQAQKNVPSVQKTLQNAAEKLFLMPCAVTGCSRTDAGVHAKTFYCTFESKRLETFPIERIPSAINLLLPEDISVKEAMPVSDEFHPRYFAKEKEYEYRIYVGGQRDPFYEGRAWMMPGRTLNVEKMQQEAEKLIGKHDFSSFCAAGSKIEDKVRTVYSCEVVKEDDLIKVRISADGFLYNMVRIIVGTLYECGVGEKHDFSAVLNDCARASAGRTAPPEGLYLTQVIY